MNGKYFIIVFFLILFTPLINSNSFGVQIGSAKNDSGQGVRITSPAIISSVGGNATGGVNMSDYWDLLDTPDDISGSEFWYNQTITNFIFNDSIANLSRLSVGKNFESFGSVELKAFDGDISGIFIRGESGDAKALSYWLDGEFFPRFRVDSQGLWEWGDGTGLDTDLFRTASGRLKTTGDFEVAGEIFVGTGGVGEGESLLVNGTGNLINLSSSNNNIFLVNESATDINGSLFLNDELVNVWLYNQTLAGSDLFVNLTGDIMTGNLTIKTNLSVSDETFVNHFTANHYHTPQNDLEFNFYDDGSEIYLNFSGENFNIEGENTKLILFDEPNQANDFRVAQFFSKEANDVTEFVVTKAGTNHASYFIRSLAVVGNSTTTSTPFNCSTYTNNIDCNTDITGADLYVSDDIELNGTLYVNNEDVNIAGTTVKQWLYNQTIAGSDLYVNLTGDTMTGDLRIKKSASGLYLNDTTGASGSRFCMISGGDNWCWVSQENFQSGDLILRFNGVVGTNQLELTQAGTMNLNGGIRADGTADSYVMGELGVGVNTPQFTIDADEGTGFGQFNLDGSSGGCLMLRDTDDAGWSKGTVLNGAITWVTDANGIC